MIGDDIGQDGEACAHGSTGGEDDLEVLGVRRRPFLEGYPLPVRHLTAMARSSSALDSGMVVVSVHLDVVHLVSVHGVAVLPRLCCRHIVELQGRVCLPACSRPPSTGTQSHEYF